MITNKAHHIVILLGVVTSFALSITYTRFCTVLKFNYSHYSSNDSSVKKITFSSIKNGVCILLVGWSGVCCCIVVDSGVSSIIQVKFKVVN